MGVNRANIPVQELNCEKCALGLVNRLSEIKRISHLQVDFGTSVVSFNFERANEIAAVENLLADLGFNPLGEEVKQKKDADLFCKDGSKDLCVTMFEENL